MARKRNSESSRRERERELSASQERNEQRYGHRASPDPELLAEHAAVAGAEASGAMLEHYGTQKGRAGSYQPAPIDGQQREPAQNRPQPRRHAASGPDAHVTRASPDGNVTIQWQDGRGPAGAVLGQHISGQATIGSMDQAQAASPSLRPQLGPRAPMGIAGAPRSMPAGTSSNQPGRPAGPASRPVHPRPVEPPAPAVKAAAPGSEFTSNVPSNDRGAGAHYPPVPETDAPGAEVGGYHPSRANFYPERRKG